MIKRYFSNKSKRRLFVLLTLIITIILIVFFTACHLEEGQQNDYNNWQNYPYIIPGSDLLFPDMEGSPEDPGEEKWISLAFNLEFPEKDKEPLYIVLLYHPDFKSTYIFGYQEPIYEENIRGEMNLADDEMDMRFSHQDIYEDDIIRVIEGKAFSYELEVRLPYKEGDSTSDMITLSVTLNSTKPPSTMYDGTVSLNNRYYQLFALTNCEVQGDMIIGDNSIKVEGVGWLEHQWGRFDIGLDWDWFAFWNEGEIELKIVDLHSSQDNLGYIMFVDSEGKIKTIDDVSINVNSTYQGFGKTWEITSSTYDLYLQISSEEDMIVYSDGYLVGFGSIEGNIFDIEVDTLTYIESTLRDRYIPIP